MGGLVAYESSDEEDEEVKPVAESKPLQPASEATADTTGAPGESADPAEVTTSEQDEAPAAAAAAAAAAAVYGPQIGPTAGPSFPPLEDDPTAAALDSLPGPPLPPPPGSPYTAERALIRDLTLPTVADLDIPASPPGSPPAATTAKFATFLRLKRQPPGTHFNARLAGSAAARNPALPDKLLAFVGLDPAGPAPYRTTLPADLCPDPRAFPRAAYKEQLRARQADAEQARARARGAPVSFIPAATTPAPVAAAESASGPTAGAPKRKTRFDT
ncbi:hypothetical protein F4780DRAFT_582897 [Xylariomycetidae sp. FL0641]|nr:hypothetical protein F4780DRAFT_582897 [Xylariomycetidae sp. FL0641]